MKKKLQVFVSSTYTDLLPERQAAVQAILKAGHIPAGMELFTSSDKSQWETIKRWINESDVYMLILGGRYGSIDADTGVSYTELEYDYAVEQGKRLFAVVITESALDDRVKTQGKAILEMVNPAALTQFREKVLKNISSFFNDEKDVRLAVHETLGDLRDNPDLKGWISGGDVEDTRHLQEEIARLKEENSKLTKAAESASRQIKGTKNEEDFSDIITILEKTMISLPEGIVGKPDLKASLLELTKLYSDSLVNGISSNASGDVLRFLYYNVCPKLSIHGLVENEKVSGSIYRRSSLNTRGKALLSEIARREHVVS